MRRRINLLLLLVCLMGLWEALYLHAGEEALRGPVETIGATIALMAGDLFWTHAAETAHAFAEALVIAVVGGVGLGLVLGGNRFAGDLFMPVLIAFASVPKVVLYPLVLLAFGLGLPAKVAFGAMFGVPPIALTTVGAVANIRPVLIKVGRTLRFAPLEMARLILIPAVLPEIMTGLRLGFSVTLIGTILGEMFAAQRGLGYLLMTSIAVHDVTMIMSLTFVLTVVAVCASAILLGVDRRLRRRF